MIITKPTEFDTQILLFLSILRVYHKPRYPDPVSSKYATATEKINATVFNTQPFKQIKPIPTASVTQPMGFKPSNLSFVQVPKAVMVQLVGSNQNHTLTSNKVIDPVNTESILPNNVEVIYQNEASSFSESCSSISENNENSFKKKKKRKAKCDNIAENAILNLSSVIQRYLDTFRKDEDPDDIFGKLIASELAKKKEPEKSKLKRNIMQMIWEDRQES